MSILRALRAPRCHTALLRERPWPRGAQAEHRRGACRCDRRNGFLPICCFLRRVCEDPSASRGLFQASQALQRCRRRLVWHAFTARTNSQPSPILKAVARALHPSLAAALANGSPTAAPACAGHRLGWRCFVYMRSYCEKHFMNNTRATGSLVRIPCASKHGRAKADPGRQAHWLLLNIMRVHTHACTKNKKCTARSAPGRTPRGTAARLHAPAPALPSPEQSLMQTNQCFQELHNVHK